MTSREYFIKVDEYRPSHNAFLSSITWPDIPEDFKVLYGWLGDTIPNFEPTKYAYKVQVPLDTPGIPALLGKNANVKRESSSQTKPLTFMVVPRQNSDFHYYSGR